MIHRDGIARAAHVDIRAFHINGVERRPTQANAKAVAGRCRIELDRVGAVRQSNFERVTAVRAAIDGGIHAVAVEPDERVASGSANERINSLAAGDVIIAASAVDDVVAGAAIDYVVAGAAVEMIIARAAVHSRARTPSDEDGVVAIATVDDRRAGAELS